MLPDVHEPRPGPDNNSAIYCIGLNGKPCECRECPVAPDRQTKDIRAYRVNSINEFSLRIKCEPHHRLIGNRSRCSEGAVCGDIKRNNLASVTDDQ